MKEHIESQLRALPILNTRSSMKYILISLARYNWYLVSIILILLEKWSLLISYGVKFRVNTWMDFEVINSIN